MDFTEKTVIKKYVYQGKILNLRVDDALLSNKKPCTREIVETSDGACVLAATSDDDIYLVKQFRYAYGKEIYELPAGKINKGETPIQCAKRELKEETGIEADKFTPLSMILPSPGYTTEKIHLFLAQELTVGKQALDEGEFLSLHKISLTKAIEMIKSGEIDDAKTVTAIIKYFSNLY